MFKSNRVNIEDGYSSLELTLFFLNKLLYNTVDLWK